MIRNKVWVILLVFLGLQLWVCHGASIYAGKTTHLFKYRFCCMIMIARSTVMQIKSYVKTTARVTSSDNISEKAATIEVHNTAPPRTLVTSPSLFFSLLMFHTIVDRLAHVCTCQCHAGFKPVISSTLDVGYDNILVSWVRFADQGSHLGHCVCRLTPFCLPANLSVD